jgi:hypothetical protein
LPPHPLFLFLTVAHQATGKDAKRHKSVVYVSAGNDKVKKVLFGDPNMRIHKSSPAHRKSFRARHHCDDNPGPKTSARYWSCRAW